MSILLEVLHELSGMFVADARLSLATLALVLAIAILAMGFGVAPLLCGALLLLGCLLILIAAVLREAHQR
jgi:hypothetical protein